MANPQLEDGFVRLANELTEALYRTKFNGTQFRILLAVIRCTYGFNKKEHEMSDNFIAEATGINIRQVKRELKKLINNKVLIVTNEGSYTEPRKIMINKYYNQWEIEVTVTENSIPNEPENINNTDIDLEDNKSPSTPPNDIQKDIIKGLGSISNEIGDHYSKLTGRPLYMGQDVVIFNSLREIDEKYRDLELIKEAMTRAMSNWKPKYNGDQIRSFKYFLPAIKEAIALKEAIEKDGTIEKSPEARVRKEQPKPSGHRTEYKPNSGFKKFQLKDD